MTRHKLVASLLVVAALPAAAGAQDHAGDFHWAKAVAAGGVVTISDVNGDIKVIPSTTGRVEVTGVRRGTNADRLRVDVQESPRGVTVCVLYDDADAYCDDRGSHSHGDGNRNGSQAQINLQVAVPANLVVHPATVSGDIDVSGANGDIEASSVSGGITLDHLRANSVQAHSVSGDIHVHVDEFTGRGDLSFKSVSGDVVLEVPQDFGADLSLSSVSGDINSDFPVTIGGNSRMNRHSLTARVGAGGRRLDVSTVSGDLQLRANK